MQVTNIREKIRRSFIEDPVLTLKAMRDAGVDHASLRHLAKKALQVDDLKFRLTVRSVLQELYQKNPAQLMWTIRKALDPCFSPKEIVKFSDSGITRKGRIEQIGAVGATIRPMHASGLVFQVPGARIMKA